MVPRRYTRYSKHVNNSGEFIDAKHINQIQEDVTELQLLGFETKEMKFEQRLQQMFYHYDFTNTLLKDQFVNESHLNLNASEGITYSAIRHCIYASDRIGIARTMGEPLSETETANDFFLQTSGYCPLGGDINYYIRLKDGRRYEILPNQITKALRLRTPITEWFCLEIELIANHAGVSPELYGYGLFYNNSGNTILNQFANAQFQTEQTTPYDTYESMSEFGRN